LYATLEACKNSWYKEELEREDVQQVCQAAGSFLLLCVFLALQVASGLEGPEFSRGWLTGPLLSMTEELATPSPDHKRQIRLAAQGLLGRTG
jgi:hypothetical protein